MSVLLVLAHAFDGWVLLLSVAWRLAITQLIGIVEIGLPILEGRRTRRIRRLSRRA